MFKVKNKVVAERSSKRLKSVEKEQNYETNENENLQNNEKNN